MLMGRLQPPTSATSLFTKQVNKLFILESKVVTHKTESFHIFSPLTSRVHPIQLLVLQKHRRRRH